MHGPFETVPAAERAEQLERRAEDVDRRDPEHVGVVEVEHTLVGVLVEQRIEHGAGLLSVLREHVAFLDVVGPLAAGQRFGVERDVADEIEGIEVPAQLLDQHGQRQALGRHFLDDRLLAVGGVPSSEEVVEACETFAQGFPGEVAQGLGNQLAVLVEVFHPLGDYGCVDAVDIDLFSRSGIGRRRKVRIDDDCFVIVGAVGKRVAVVIDGRYLGRVDGIVVAGFIDLHGFAVELRVREMAGRAPEIDQREIELARVLVHAGAAADDLLELGHRANSPVEHDQPAGLHVDAGGKQARRGDQDGEFRFRVDEVAEFVLPLGIPTGDAHDVAAVAGHEVGVLVDQRLAHARGVFLIDAEDDGLLEAVSAFLEELRDLPRHNFRSAVDDECAVEVLDVVDAVLDFLALAVELTSFWPVALHVAVDVDLDHLVGCEETVADALLQGVGVDRLAEVGDVGDVLCFFRRRGEAYLGGRGEVLQNLAPC